jgi:hypothetical protein
LEKALEFGVKLCETHFTILVQMLWILNKRNCIHHTFFFLDLGYQKLIEVAIALKASLSEADFKRRIVK